MKAYSLNGVGDLRYIDAEYPECPEDWVIVKVKAVGICGSDIPRVFTKGTYHFPTIPGHEFSGIVDKIGNSVDKNLLGKRVGVFPLIPCRKCLQCVSGNYEMCSDYDYIGSRRDGAFAEYVAVPAWNLIEFSEKVSFIEAAIMEPLAVSLHAVKRASIKKNDSVAIVGSGPIGFSTAQWALMHGAGEVTVIGSSANKKVLADRIEGIRYEVADGVKEEFDVVFEAVGRNSAINEAINIVRPGGKLVLMGNPENDICFSQDTYWRILRKQLWICGSWNSSYEYNAKSDWADVKEALENKWLQAGKFVSHIFSQENLLDGLELMREHQEVYCKVITLWNE